MILAWSWRSGKPNGDPGLAWPGLVLVLRSWSSYSVKKRPSALALVLEMKVRLFFFSTFRFRFL
jgi:hypothetical protein